MAAAEVLTIHLQLTTLLRRSRIVGAIVREEHRKFWIGGSCLIEHLFDELRILIGAYGKRGADGIVVTFGCHLGKFIETEAIA